MKWTILVASVLAALSAFSTAPVVANDLTDVVRARANARAGGTSNHDAWVLKRHGKLSGSGTHRKRAIAKKRALLAAKKKKAAAAKKRAFLLAKKKKEAEKRALIAAKKKKAAEKAAQRKLAAVEAPTPVATYPQANAATEKTESAFVSPPSTSTLMTSHEIAPETNEAGGVDRGPEVAVAKDTAQTTNNVEPVAQDNAVGNAQTKDDDGCKRFLPAIGLTVSVGCE